MKLLLDQNLSPRLREALQQFTIPYSQPVSPVIPAQVGIQAPDRWMPDHVRHDESGTAGLQPNVKRPSCPGPGLSVVIGHKTLQARLG